MPQKALTKMENVEHEGIVLGGALEERENITRVHKSPQQNPLTTCSGTGNEDYTK